MIAVRSISGISKWIEVDMSMGREYESLVLVVCLYRYEPCHSLVNRKETASDVDGAE